MTRPLLGRILLPVANEEDAEATCEAIRPYLPEGDCRLIALYVVETGGGAPGSASPEQFEQHGRDALTAAEGAFADSGITVETELRYGTDIVETIFEAAVETDVDCIAFVPRTKGRLVAFLSGDLGWKLTNRAECPILTFPYPEEAT